MIFCTDDLVLIQVLMYYYFNSFNIFLPVTRILLLHGEVTLGRQWIKRLVADRHLLKSFVSMCRDKETEIHINE